jgi:hypothetical protein
MTPKDLEDVTLGNMPQASGSSLGGGMEMHQYTIPRRPVGNSGIRDTQEASPLVQPDDGRAHSPTSTLNPRYEDEPHSHYYDASGMSRSIQKSHKWTLSGMRLGRRHFRRAGGRTTHCAICNGWLTLWLRYQTQLTEVVEH